MLMKWLGVEAMALSPLRIECKLQLFVHQSFKISVNRYIGTNMFFISVGVLARSPNRPPIRKALRDDAQVKVSLPYLSVG